MTRRLFHDVDLFCVAGLEVKTSDFNMSLRESLRLSAHLQGPGPVSLGLGFFAPPPPRANRMN